MKTLILTVGLPRSGKSTWAKETGLPIVNPDSVRLALHGERFVAKSEPMIWTITAYMVQALFLAGHDQIVLDATNITKERRARFKSKDWTRLYKLMTATEHECLLRCDLLNDEYIKPVIRDMAAAFEPIQQSELCDGDAILS